ncbi:Protein of unknown function DUF4666 [Dillenia turbinata]|uniref:Uncharacterized protein n=1 Tax=Dillenia turbinata TaxID=194707 RepID=A0AAN8ZTV7_9MAGN
MRVCLFLPDNQQFFAQPRPLWYWRPPFFLDLSGAFGLVWDDKVISGDMSKQSQTQEGDKEQAAESAAKIESGKSNGGQTYRTMKVAPSYDPPSPRVSGCGLCGAFGKSEKKHKAKSGKRR